ncbi:MAG: hypothetical protein AB1540_10990 [Bdellovibrionota bacterium]
MTKKVNYTILDLFMKCVLVMHLLWFRYFFFVVAILSGLACGQEKKVASEKSSLASQRSSESNALYFPYEIPFKETAALTDLEKSIHAKIENHAALDYAEITQAIELIHLNHYNDANNANVTEDELKQFLGELSQPLKESLPVITRLKPTYEIKLEAIIKPNSFDYLVSADSLVDVLKNGAAQCYSGTILFESLYRRTHSVQQFIDANRVVIHAPGHILPGFLVKESDLKWRLYGIETTVNGRGIVDYGATAELDSPIRVVDANDFLITEVFRKHLEPTKIEVFAQSVLKSTADRFAIPLEKLEAKIQALQGSQVKSSKPYAQAVYVAESGKWEGQKINSTLFGFGRADIPEGRQKRNYQDILPPEQPRDPKDPEDFFEKPTNFELNFAFIREKIIFLEDIPESAKQKKGENAWVIKPELLRQLSVLDHELMTVVSVSPSHTRTVYQDLMSSDRRYFLRLASSEAQSIGFKEKSLQDPYFFSLGALEVLRETRLSATGAISDVKSYMVLFAHGSCSKQGFSCQLNGKKIYSFLLERTRREGDETASHLVSWDEFRLESNGEIKLSESVEEN